MSMASSLGLSHLKDRHSLAVDERRAADAADAPSHPQRLAPRAPAVGTPRCTTGRERVPPELTNRSPHALPDARSHPLNSLSSPSLMAHQTTRLLPELERRPRPPHLLPPPARTAGGGVHRSAQPPRANRAAPDTTYAQRKQHTRIHTQHAISRLSPDTRRSLARGVGGALSSCMRPRHLIHARTHTHTHSLLPPSRLCCARRARAVNQQAPDAAVGLSGAAAAAHCDEEDEEDASSTAAACGNEG